MRNLEKTLVVSLAFASVSIVHAQTVWVNGAAEGAFNVQAFTSSASGDDIRSIFGLGYKRATFSGDTTDGFIAFGGNDQDAFVSGPPNNFNNWGSFTLLSNPQSYTGNTFTLKVDFTSPAMNGGTLAASITGQVSSIPDGGVTIDFDNNYQYFQFNNGSVDGWLWFRVNDLSVHHGQTEAVSGDVHVTPEPASCLALAPGLIGLWRRRRTRTK